MEEKNINWVGSLDHIRDFKHELTDEHPNLKLVCTDYPVAYHETDLYIVDFSLYKCFSETIDTSASPPCIVYGDSPSVFTGSLASDYCDVITLPMQKHELVFRIYRNIRSSSIHFGIDKITFCQRTVSGRNKTEPITHIQYKLLRLFSNYPGILYTRETISQYIGIKKDVQSRLVDVYVSQLRKKLKHVMGIDDTFDPIICVRGKGYRIERKLVDNL